MFVSFLFGNYFQPIGPEVIINDLKIDSTSLSSSYYNSLFVYLFVCLFFGWLIGWLVNWLFVCLFICKFVQIRCDLTIDLQKSH